MILYNEKINRSQYPLVFLKTDSGKRINNLVYTVVTNDVQQADHKNGFCYVKAKVMCTMGKISSNGMDCYLEGHKLFLPDGERLPVDVLHYDPPPDGYVTGYATFTCLAHYE